MGALGGDAPACVVASVGWSSVLARDVWAIAGDEPRANPWFRQHDETRNFLGGVGSRLLTEEISTTVAHIDALWLLPKAARHLLVAERLDRTFAAASPVVRTHVARLGTSVLQPRYTPTDVAVKRAREVMIYPAFDVGDRHWSRTDLGILGRAFKADGVVINRKPRSVRLVELPRRNAGLVVVLRRFADLFEPGRSYPTSEVDATIGELHYRPRMVRDLLVTEGLIAPVGTSGWRRIG